MHQFQAEIEKEIGEPAEWIDASVASRIVITKKVAGIFSESEAETYFDWLYKKQSYCRKYLVTITDNLKKDNEKGSEENFPSSD
jgi:hypothetical protein